MEWDFTPEQVVKADVDYSLEQFRLDMSEEVRLNMNQMDDAQQRKIFDVMYDLCYWVATGSDYDDFLAGLDQESFFPSFLPRAFQELPAKPPHIAQCRKD